MQNIITSNPNKEIEINWIREGKEFKNTITPQSITKYLNGELVDVGVIGISPYFNTIEATFLKSINCYQSFIYYYILDKKLFVINPYFMLVINKLSYYLFESLDL